MGLQAVAIQGYINWDGVWQSIVDTWIPLLIAGIVVAAVLIVFRIIRKRKR